MSQFKLALLLASPEPLARLYRACIDTAFLHPSVIPDLLKHLVEDLAEAFPEMVCAPECRVLSAIVQLGDEARDDHARFARGVP